MNKLPGKSIFRAYDIRGIYPLEINENYALLIGKALGTFFVRKGFGKCVVGCDDRSSSPSILENLINGLLNTGVDVTDTGLTLTPAIHYLTFHNDFDFGINVTASHNPKEYNGFRIDYAGARPFFGDDVTDLYNLIKKNDFEAPRERGVYTKRDLADEYINYFIKTFKFTKKLRVVIDCGNGAVSKFGKEIFESTGCEVLQVRCELDSEFSKGMPNPEDKKFMKELSKQVKVLKADLGFAFDADGDRFGVVDECGNIYENDKIMLLIAENILNTHPGERVYYDIKCSGVVESEIKRMGGVPIMIRTGHPFFVEHVRKDGLIGCELSGHMYFKHGNDVAYDDGIYAACRVLEVLDNKNKSLSLLMNKYPKRFHSDEIKVKCPDDLKFLIIDDIKSNLQNSGHKFLNIDGVRASVTDTDWFLIRASNTSPYLSIRMEGLEPARVWAMREIILSILRKYHLDMSELKKAKIIYS